MTADRRMEEHDHAKATAPKRYEVPFSYSFWQFRRAMGWVDEDVLLNQPDENVWVNWEIYQLENEGR